MSTYSSNCPISRPVILPEANADADFGGMSWSNKYGLFFVVEDEMLPIKTPVKEV